MSNTIQTLTTYGQELAADGFEVWLTPMGHGNYADGYLQYRDPETGAWGSLQESFTEGWQHLMPLVPSREYGSSMFLETGTDPFTVKAARECARPTNRNSVVGTRANAGDRTWRSPSAYRITV